MTEASWKAPLQTSAELVRTYGAIANAITATVVPIGNLIRLVREAESRNASAS